MNDQYVWISRWSDFQHYRPNPERGPAWIKQHTSQLSDDRYLSLTDRQRSLLHDLRMVFSAFRGRLPRNTLTIARQRHRQTFRSDIDALEQAGLIQIISRETLEQRLDLFYRRSRVEVEVEKEEDKNPPLPQPSTYNGGSSPQALPDLADVLKDMPL